MKVEGERLEERKLKDHKDPPLLMGGVLSPEEIRRLEDIARRIRIDVLRMTTRAGSGHPGGCLSCADIITALYFKVLRHDPKNPSWEDRDRFILSKGHSAPALYAALAEAGYFDKSLLMTLRRPDSILQGHTDMTKTPGVEMSAGSLGQGLSFGVGMAIAAKLKKKDYRIYVLLGDGECDEGQVWEAAMASSHFALDNITAIIDRNRQQIDGWTEEVMSLEPLGKRWEAFGWRVMEIDGHNFVDIVGALEEAKREKGRPTVIIAHTIKGKGVSFMENNLEFHGRALKEDELERALRELEG